VAVIDWRGRIAAFVSIALVGSSCARPKPPPPPPPAPPPIFQPVPVAPQESLSIQGSYQPAGGGKYLVVIFVNGRRTIDGSLSAQKRRDRFHGQYNGHDVDADCVLGQKVDCVISIDGAPHEPGERAS
jgi:hypothetical protein